MVTVLFVPMWQIQLSAPQYPEGLVLLIYPHTLGGNVEIINGLNHYIGMKPIHAGDFVEFRVLPYIVGFFAAGLLLTAITGSRLMFRIFFVLFVIFGVVAMIDFWKWEYDYGHNLNPDAAIIVPGMAYQPPLIGFKQLLNFQAYSIPDIGGWLFVSVGVLMAVVLVADWNSLKKKKTLASKAASATLLVLLFMHLSSCSQGPQPIVPGRDNCDFCRMKVSDTRFGGEIVTSKGKVYKFDDIHCLLSFVNRPEFDRTQIGQVYLVDFSGNHALLLASETSLLESDALLAPMGGHLAAFKDPDSLHEVANTYKGSVLKWDNVYKR
jgi:copper chaperone NosL